MSAAFDLGELVVDKDADPDDQNEAVVVQLPDEVASEYQTDTGRMVAEYNPGYGPFEPTVVVAFRTALDTYFPIWEHAAHEALAKLCENERIPVYAYPEARLERYEDDE